MKSKKLISLLLATALLAGTMAGCGDKEAAPNKPDAKQPEEAASQYAYKATYLPLTAPNGEDMNISESCVIDGKLYYAASYLDGTIPWVDDITGQPKLDEAGEPIETENYVTNIFVFDPATQETTQMEGFVPAEIPEGMQGNTSIGNLLPGADGSLWIGETVYTYSFDLPEDFDAATQDPYAYYVPGENQQLLTHYGSDGTKLETVQLQVAEDTYISKMFALSDGRILTFDWQNVYVYGKDGVLTDTITLDNVNGEPVDLGNDQIAVSCYDMEANQPKLMRLDLEKKALADGMALPMNAYQTYPGFGEYEFLYQINDTIFGMKKDAAEGERLFSWMDADVDSGNVRQFHILDDGTIMALETTQVLSGGGFSSSGMAASSISAASGTNTVMKTNLIILEQVEASTLPQKQELTLGCIGLDWGLRTSIVKFNREHDDIRIAVKDYSESLTGGDDYESAYNAVIQKLSTEILSGSAPDILITDNLPVEQYATKGILVDLWPLIDSDPELSREDLMTHFFDELSIDDKLYQVSATFGIQTAATYTEIADGRTSWTFDEMMEALNNLGDGAAIFGETDIQETMLDTMVSHNLDTFMDWETGTCNFESKEFMDILSFAAQFPAEFDYSNYDWDTMESPYTRMKNGKQLMHDAWISGYDDVQFVAGLLDNRASYIGYPTESGSGSYFFTSGSLSITSTCKNVDTAWSFVRTILTEEYQTQQQMYRFPTNKHAFDAYTEKAMTPEYTTNPETGEQEEVSTGGIGYNDFMLDLYAIKQADYDAFMSLYENCSGFTTQNSEVMNLIKDHAAAYFGGQKTLEETAKLIQDNVSLYMMEQG